MELQEGGLIIVLDLGVESIRFYDSIGDYVRKITDEKVNFDSVADIVYRVVMSDLIRMLNLPPAEAIEHLSKDNTTDYIPQFLKCILCHEQDLFSEICKESLLNLYIKMRSQLEIKMNVQYTSQNIGMDYVVVREIMMSYVPMTATHHNKIRNSLWKH